LCRPEQGVMPIESTQRDQVLAACQVVTVDPEVPADVDAPTMVLAKRHSPDWLEHRHVLTVHGCEPDDALHENPDRGVLAEVTLDLSVVAMLDDVALAAREQRAADPADDRLGE